MRRTLALTALVVMLAGCGDDGPSNDPAYVDVISTELQAEDGGGFNEDQADCAADGVLTAVGGSDALEEEGISPEELAEVGDVTELGVEVDEDEAVEAIISVFDDCDISMADLYLQGLEAEGGEVSEELRGCVEENIDEDEIREFLAAFLVASESEAVELSEDYVDVFLELEESCPDLTTSAD